MRSLFELVPDEDLKHYIHIWERNVYPKEFKFGTPKSINELKSYLGNCRAYDKLLSESLESVNKELRCNLINEIFNYLDKKTLS